MIDAYQRFHAATAAFREAAVLDTTTPTTGGCACCGRPWDQVEDTGEAVPYRYGSGFANQLLCTTCYTPKIADENLLGIERMAGRSGKMVAGKLAMLPGCGGVVTTDNVLHLALNPGFMRKFEHGTLAAAGCVHECRPMALLLRLYRDGRLGRPEDGFVYISVFGRKSLGLMGDLQITRDLAELCENSENGAGITDLEALLDVAAWVTDHDLETKATKYAFWAEIQKSARGVDNRVAVGKWLDKLPGDGAELIGRLPSNPYDRLGLHTKMGDIFQVQS